MERALFGPIYRKARGHRDRQNVAQRPFFEAKLEEQNKRYQKIRRYGQFPGTQPEGGPGDYAIFKPSIGW